MKSDMHNERRKKSKKTKKKQKNCYYAQISYLRAPLRLSQANAMSPRSPRLVHPPPDPPAGPPTSPPPPEVTCHQLPFRAVSTPPGHGKGIAAPAEANPRPPKHSRSSAEGNWTAFHVTYNNQPNCWHGYYIVKVNLWKNFWKIFFGEKINFFTFLERWIKNFFYFCGKVK